MKQEATHSFLNYVEVEPDQFGCSMYTSKPALELPLDETHWLSPRTKDLSAMHAKVQKGANKIA